MTCKKCSDINLPTQSTAGSCQDCGSKTASLQSKLCNSCGLHKASCINCGEPLNDRPPQRPMCGPNDDCCHLF